MFVVSGAIDRDREFWWDALARAMLGPERGSGTLSLQIGDRMHRWELADHDPGCRQVHRQVWAALRDRPPAERDDLAEEVLAWAGLPRQARATHRTLRSAELDRLASDELIEIGAHTANHPRLAALSPDTPAARDRGRPVGARGVHLTAGDLLRLPAWRSGRCRAHRGRARFAPQDSGRAYLATPGRLRARSDPYRLPRLFVEDMDGAEFARLLWRYAGIKVS